MQVAVAAQYFQNMEGTREWCLLAIGKVRNMIALFVHRLFCYREFRSLDQTGQILCMIIVHKDVFNDLWGIYE